MKFGSNFNSIVPAYPRARTGISVGYLIFDDIYDFVPVCLLNPSDRTSERPNLVSSPPLSVIHVRMGNQTGIENTRIR
ncbi:hypothetical protein BDFB_014804 [Asbolus verrucosus]|uniref:Uncharacterized protein n=1 Tax=Asbolus verrucosus TaxID=1661398 RepID=A0A482WDJ2_ASBVE|nr:hypothetical protein BDFB_014804 [Asbolus verrucosus]